VGRGRGGGALAWVTKVKASHFDCSPTDYNAHLLLYLGEARHLRLSPLQIADFGLSRNVASKTIRTKTFGTVPPPPPVPHHVFVCTSQPIPASLIFTCQQRSGHLLPSTP